MHARSIRRAREDDIPALYGVDHNIVAEPTRRQFIDRAVREQRAWVIEHSGRIVGYGVISYDFFGRSFLDLVSIAENQRSKGLGPELILAMEKQSRSRDFFTSTNESNVHMRHVLAKLGYEPSGIIYNLDPGDPELVFVKRLQRLERSGLD